MDTGNLDTMAEPSSKPVISVHGAIAEEIIGDCNNLKGTSYHLVYALWLLLREQARTVAFYAGNDLLAKPTPPPDPKAVRAQAPIGLMATQQDEDLWIQLKSTDATWTVLQLLRDNLLRNFLHNLINSSAQGRRGRAILVSTAKVDKKGILNFLSGQGKQPKGARARLDSILRGVIEDLIEAGQQPPSLNEVRTLAHNILTEIAEAEPVPLAVLRAEVESAVMRDYPDSGSVSTLASTLLGAMLDDSAKGPPGRLYDNDWIEGSNRR